MNSVEGRVRAAMSAAVDLADREIRSAPPLRLPPAPAPGGRRPRAPRRWIRWAAPLTAAAVVVALAVSLVLIRDVQNGGPVTQGPATSTAPVGPAGPDGVPRYYVAISQQRGVVVGDSVAGTILAKVAPPTHKGYTTFFKSVTAAADDRTFVVLAETYPDSVIKSPAGIQKSAVTASWYELRLAPGTADPASLTLLPLPRMVTTGSDVGAEFATALSGSGRELAVSTVTAAGLAVKVYSVATGKLLHDWTTSDPSLSLTDSYTQGLNGQPSLTWIDGDRVLAVETASATQKSTSKNPFLGFGAKDVVRELTVAGPATGDLVADGKVVWDEQTWEYPTNLLQSCTGERGEMRLISADGTTVGCFAVTGPGTNPNLSFLTYPLETGPAVAAKATVEYGVTHMAQKGISTNQVMWISPSGDAIVGAWTTYAAGTLEDAANGLHIGVMSHGTFTPLRFPVGFDQEANVSTITW